VLHNHSVPRSPPIAQDKNQSDWAEKHKRFVDFLYPVSDENGRTEEENTYRREVLMHLDQQKMWTVAGDYSRCQDPEHFRFLACPENPEHFLKHVVYSCHLRICPECARREHRRLVGLWRPLLAEAIATAPIYFHPSHIVFTTARNIRDDDIGDQFAPTISAVDKTIKLYFESLRKVARYEIRKSEWIKNKGSASKRTLFLKAARAMQTDAIARKLRSRLVVLRRQNRGWWFNRIKRKLAAGVSLKGLKIGYLVGAEFGEKSQHLHMHAFYFGPYLEHDLLVEIWQQVTGAKVIYINGGMSVEAAVDEVFKYATKLTTLAPALVPKLHRTLEGHRRVRAYGLFHGMTVKADKPCTECPACGSQLEYWSEDQYAVWVESNIEIYLKTGNKSERAPPLEQQLLAGFENISASAYQDTH